MEHVFREYRKDQDLEAVRRIWMEIGWIDKDQMEVVDLMLGAGRTLVAEMNAPYETPTGPLVRLEMTAFNLEDPEERARFVAGEVKEIVVPGSTRTVTYDPLERVGVGLSRLGTSKAVALGAYAFALTALDAGS